MTARILTFRSAKVVASLIVSLTIVACAAIETNTASRLASGDMRPASGCADLPDTAKATMVIFDPGLDRTLVCNENRANRRFVPASTFKIAHSLIALETGAVVDENRPFEWDGRDRGVPAWNGDKSMVEAVPASAVWVFQEIARRVGHRSEQAWVDRLDFGDKNVGAESDLLHFWLSGPLTISATEQIEFLRRLHDDRLDASAVNMAKVRTIIRMEGTTDGGVVHGKTGAMLPIDDAGFLRQGQAGLLPVGTERTGWFVGWIDRPGSAGPVYFALNLDLDLPDAMAARTAAAYAVLSANGYAVPAKTGGE